MTKGSRSSAASVRFGALALVTALALAGCSGRSDGGASDGGEAAPITIGASWPQSGPLGSLAPGLHGLQAYIDQVNEDGGVNRHPINLVTADDAYDPARLSDNFRKFVEQNDAIAVVNFGAIVAPTRDYLKQKGVAGVSLAGNDVFNDVETYPLHRAFWPNVNWEGQAQAQWITENRPGAVVGYLGFNNDLTDSQLAGLEAGGIEVAQIAEVAPGTADVSAEVSKFQAAGVDTLIINIGAPTVGAVLGYMNQIGWKPTVFLGSTTSDYVTAINQATPEAVSGAYSFQFYKDPSDPQWSEDQNIVEFEDAMDAAGYSDEAHNATALNGYGLGAAVVAALESADEYTSEGFIAAWDSFDNVENPLLWPGITLNGGPHGRVIFDYVLTQFDGVSWVAQGGILNAIDEGWVQ